MKRFLSVLVVMTLMLTLAGSVLASGANDTEEFHGFGANVGGYVRSGNLWLRPSDALMRYAPKPPAPVPVVPVVPVAPATSSLGAKVGQFVEKVANSTATSYVKDAALIAVPTAARATQRAMTRTELRHMEEPPHLHAPNF